MEIVGLSGYARSGKDTVAQYLVEHHGFIRMAFADPMREALLRLNPLVSLGGLYVPVSQALVYSNNDWELFKTEFPEVRGLLQRLGTEVGRNMLGENIWVDYALKSIPFGTQKVVFSDVRFKNEANTIRENQGSIWRIERPETGPVNDHPSETEMDDYDFHLRIVNDTSKEDLYAELDKLMDRKGA